MIIYGRSAEKVRAQEHLVPSSCPVCNTQNSLIGVVLMCYAHVWYIPFFPLRKRVVAVCGHCKGNYDIGQLRGENAQVCTILKQNVKFPVWYWSLAIIIGVVIVVSMIVR
ncbi:MAG: hypothetical protein J0I41_09745 [Filimonas sp.]|nr:hypothetical protein [Filimonas sp.]